MLLGARVLLLCSQGRQSNRFYPQDLGLDLYGPMFTPLNVKASLYLWNGKKRTFLESLNKHLKYNVFSQDYLFQNVIFPHQGKFLKDLFYPISTLLFSQKPELNTDICSKPFSICRFLDYKSTRDL